jgi:pilus assembly protein Flp/PilA
MLALMRNLTKKDEGASAVEYGLLVAAIAALIILVVFAIGKFVKSAFDETCDGFDTGASATIQGAATCP